MAEGIPNGARQLLATRIASVAQLEAVLLLHALAAPFGRGPEAGASPEGVGARDAAAVGGALRIDARAADGILRELGRAQLVAVHTDAAGRRLYRFPIEDAALRAAVDELRAAYAERRVSVISLIFSRPSPAVQSFSEAFRLRPDVPGKEPPRNG